MSPNRCILALLLALGFLLPVRGQDVLETARMDVERLASPEFRGRGYVGDGHTKAAAYIRERFIEIGLQPVEGEYEQPFEMQADVFPETPSLSVNGKALRVGHAFLPFSSSASGRQDATNRVLVVDMEDFDREIPKEAVLHRAALMRLDAVVFLEDRLTYGFSPYNAELPAFDVVRSAWPNSVESVSFDVQSRQDQPFTTQNVMGLVPGTAVPDSFIVVGAHYDHNGALGDSVYFPGANDNASGVALVLALARYFEAHPIRYSLVFVAFGGEENGLLGAFHFVQHPPVPLDRIRFMLNFDMVASAEAGIVAVGGADHPEAFAHLSAINDRLASGPLGQRTHAPNSDQHAFVEQGIPAFYLYTNKGRQPYHHIEDRPETLEWEDFRHAYELARRFIPPPAPPFARRGVSNETQ